MTSFANILIFQPAAIGDVMLATPVAKTLKHNYPGAKITFWGHTSLRQLLVGLCPYIDEYIDYDRKTGLISMLKTFWDIKSDLYVDLSNSKKGIFMAAFSPANSRFVAYKKQNARAGIQIHAVDNFLASIKSICDDAPSPLFPTLFPDVLAAQMAAELFADKGNKLLIGIVPGVGKMRPHRAWILEGWHYLLTALEERGDCLPVLIGGLDEMELAEKIVQEHSAQCLNLTGKLELTQTAALLKLCQVVISGDTGPAHMAVAVGTPVVGLYGPTYPSRSGPYGCDHLTLDQSGHCQCHGLKSCAVAKNDAPGECMHRIMLPEILDKLNQALMFVE